MYISLAMYISLVSIKPVWEPTPFYILIFFAAIFNSFKR